MQAFHSECPPSGVNGSASALTRHAEPGQRAGTLPKLSNLDATGQRIVRRGSVVEYPGGFTARVARVRLGYFVPSGVSSWSYSSCSQVRVIA